MLQKERFLDTALGIAELRMDAFYTVFLKIKSKTPAFSFSPSAKQWMAP